LCLSIVHSHLACEERRNEVAIALKKHGARTDTLNADERTPLDLCDVQLRKTLTHMTEST
jgi:hypothetical protein